MDNLSLSSAIFVREDLSQKYLSKFPVLNEKIHFIADPAFMMMPLPYNLTKKSGKIYIGINMSLLAIGHSIKDPLQIEKANKDFAHILDSLLEKNSTYELVFIPHVNQDGAQNDLDFLSPVYEEMEHKENVQIIPSGLGARKTKGLLSNLDLLVAARMHCCVGGISMNTPTLFVTYSNKGKGISYYAYNHHNYEISCKEIFENSNKFENLISSMLKKKDDIKRNLQERNNVFKTDAMKAGEILSAICNTHLP